MNTFYFQAIASQVTNTSYRGSGLYTGWLQNASGWKYQHIYQVGRDGQTKGRRDKADTKPHIPICPYHMPTNRNRFNDPGLNIPYKNVGNIIELKDINRLIERITLYTHLWNAEANDISNYGISSKKRSKLNINLLPLGTTLDIAKTVSITNGQNTTRQNTPYLRIGYFSQAEYNALDHSQFSNPSSIITNTISNIKDYIIGENIGISFPDTTKGELTSSGNPIVFQCGQEPLYRVSAYLDANYRLVLNYYPDSFVEQMNATEDLKYDKNRQETFQYQRNNVGGILIDNSKYFVLPYREPDEKALKPVMRYLVFKVWFYDSITKQYNTTPTTITRETDWSVQEQLRNKRGKHPIIQAKIFSNVQDSLSKLIEALNGIANTTFSNLTDNVTKNDITDFKSIHAKYHSDFNPNDPDTNFYGYQANKTAIIKVGFYNTLVDAYKLLINSCMCNCDCKCNSNCVCNTNCGCNYG